MDGLNSFFFFCLTVGIVTSNVQARLSAESIIAGTESGPHEFPYVISLQSNGSHLCGGGIINEQFILTAAHCLIDEENNFWDGELEIVAGTNNLKEDSDTKVKVGVAEVYASALYNGGSEDQVGDIAILKLKEKLNLDENSGLGKLKLPPNTKDGLNDSNSFAEQEAIIAGFGWDKVEIKIDLLGDLGVFNVTVDGSSTGKLIKAKVKIFSSDICEMIEFHSVDDSQLCANIVDHEEGVTQGVCHGDSGSPLIQNGMAIGLVSNGGMDCDNSERPGIYTRVSAYVDLIENVMKGIDTVAVRFHSY